MASITIYSEERLRGSKKTYGAAWLKRDQSWVVDSAGPANIQEGVPQDAGKALDGDVDTYWDPMTGHGYNDWFIVLDLKKPYTLTRIALNNYGDHTHDAAAFKLQTSQVGSPYSWEDVVSVDDVQAKTDERQELGGFTATAQYLRFVITQTHTGWQPWLRELNFFGLAGTASVEDVPSGQNTCYSIKVDSGEWLVYSNNNFEGTSIRLPTGIYPDPGHIRSHHCGTNSAWNDQVRSLRSINQDGITLFDKNDFCGADKTYTSDNPNIEMDNCCSIIVRGGWWAVYPYGDYNGSYDWHDGELHLGPDTSMRVPIYAPGNERIYVGSVKKIPCPY